MKILPGLAGCVFLLLFIPACFAQQGAKRSPLLGDIADIKGKTKFFLIANEEYKTILRMLTNQNTGLRQVATPDEADFVVEYAGGRMESNIPDTRTGAPRYVHHGWVHLQVYYMNGDRRVLVWNNGPYGAEAERSTNRSSDQQLAVAAAELTKRFLKDLRN